MIDPKVEQGINDQINAELYSSYLYFAMANYFEQISLPGAAHWMRAQALEEMTHVTKFADYLNDRRGKVVLVAIDAPPAEWESPMAAFTASYEHETTITTCINKLLDLALANSDHATANFLQWFVSEQVEEEANVDAVVQQLKLVAQTEGGLFLIDKDLASRQLSAAPDSGQTDA